MSTLTYFEDPLFPAGDDVLADQNAEATTAEVLVSNFFGSHQIYLRLTNGESVTNFHLTKEQANELGTALISAESSIGYDNTEQIDDA